MQRLASGWGLSSVYDFDADGRTTAADVQVVQQNLGRTCPASHGVY